MPKSPTSRGLRNLARSLFCCALLSNTLIALSKEAPPTPEMLERIRVANDECFSCHSEAGLKSPPKTGMDLAKLKGMLIDAAALKASDHDQMACTKCHKKGYAKHPHAEDAPESLAECQECHAKKSMRIERQFDKSVHAENVAEKMTCAKCHDAHVMRIAAKLGDPRKIVAQDNKACLKCHDSDTAFADIAPDVPETKQKKKRPPIDKIHEWLPNTQLHWQAVRCVECHTPPDEKILSHEILSKKKAEKKCVICHSANTALKTRLYRHLAAEEENKLGFLNSVVLRDSYVVGATRNPTLDRVLIGLIGLTFGAIVVHGVIRLLLSLRRKRND